MPKKRRRKRTTTMVCSACGVKTEIKANELHAAKRPQCSACGGTLNRPKDLPPAKKPKA